jgi:ribosomal protein S18 acetylase RimI-like enzyme
VIRRATREDAEAIAQVHLATWQFAYAELLAPEEIASVTLADRVAVWQGVLDEGGAVWVAQVDGRLAGLASIDGSQLTALYVDPIAQGAGVGTALLEEAQRAGACSLEVLASNGHARTFYAARGWRDAGEGKRYRGEPTRRYVL